MSVDQFAQRLWYGPQQGMSLLLLPLSWLFGAIVRMRRWAYRHGVFKSVRIGVPVLVIGNLTVGGTGKTPLVAWLANACRQRGVRAAVICRGHGGRNSQEPTVVQSSSDPIQVGDEAVVLAQAFDGLVIACADRVAAASRAAESGAELIISDDGLQHYRLQRDCEWVVMDAARGWGNGRLLPAGPLREPISRAAHTQLMIRTVRDRSVANAPAYAGVPAVDVRSQVLEAVSLRSGERRSLNTFREMPLHALAGIGHPDAFFAMLKTHGLTFDTRVLPDHATIRVEDLQFADAQPVLMTDKDAVKCRAFADERLWRVPLQIEVSAEHEARLWSVIQRTLSSTGRTDHHS
jgi:tetraacyldisaccharide 4'-kinase